MTSIVWLVGCTVRTTLGLFTLTRCNNGSLVDLTDDYEMFMFDQLNEEVIAFTLSPAIVIVVIYCLDAFELCCPRRNLALRSICQREIIHKRLTIMVLVDASVSIIKLVPWRLLLSEALLSDDTSETIHPQC